MPIAILKLTKPYLTVDTATSGNLVFQVAGNSYYKLNDFVVLSANRTFTLSGTGAKEGSSLYIALIDVEFGVYTITIADSSGLMPVITVNSSTALEFKFSQGRWYRII